MKPIKKLWKSCTIFASNAEFRIPSENPSKISCRSKNEFHFIATVQCTSPIKYYILWITFILSSILSPYVISYFICLRCGCSSFSLLVIIIFLFLVYHIQEETDRREGKGRHCCLGDGIHSVNTDLALGWFDEKD